MCFKVCKFYGWTYDYAKTLPIDELTQASSYMEVIEAKSTLDDMRLMDYPHMSKEDRNKFYKAVHKQAYPKSLYKKKVMSTTDLAKLWKQKNG